MLTAEVPEVIPEPSTLLLLGSGLLAVGLWRRNQAKLAGYFSSGKASSRQ